MATSFVERQLSIYSTYHRDWRNRATHAVGIPAILFSVLVLTANGTVSIAGYPLSLAWVVAIVSAAGWIALDAVIGLAMMVALVPMVLGAVWLAGLDGARGAERAFAALFVGGWILQFVGHAFEGRRPALVDNLFQAFIGPMFIMAELLSALGVRRTSV